MCIWQRLFPALWVSYSRVNCFLSIFIQLGPTCQLLALIPRQIESFSESPFLHLEKHLGLYLAVLASEILN